MKKSRWLVRFVWCPLKDVFHLKIAPMCFVKTVWRAISKHALTTTSSRSCVLAAMNRYMTPMFVRLCTISKRYRSMSRGRCSSLLIQTPTWAGVPRLIASTSLNSKKATSSLSARSVRRRTAWPAEWTIMRVCPAKSTGLIMQNSKRTSSFSLGKISLGSENQIFPKEKFVLPSKNKYFLRKNWFWERGEDFDSFLIRI